MTPHQPPRRINLLPRDLSESLGKLPPQNLEMEESVLAALLMESRQIERLSSFLSPSHFYKETHALIYRAILTLHRTGSGVDMRLVSQELARAGHLELVGGRYAIAELSTKTSSAENIEAHARIVIEMAIKRELIQIASAIHHDAYEDSTDALELLEQKIQDLQRFKDLNTGSNSEEKIKSLWESILVTIAPEEQPPLLYHDGVPVMVPGNHTMLVGKKKSRKTLLIVHFISQYLKANPQNANSVLLFDTEQGRSHVFKIREKIHQICGALVPVFYLRGMSPAERRDVIRDTVEYWPDRPKIAVIDGVRDLMSNINDPDETTDVIVWLEKLTLQHNISILEVLHLNKTDNNARGHIGSELLNKAYMTIEVELDEKTGSSVVKCESSRDKPFETFAFWHDRNGLPELLEVPAQGNALPAAEKNDRISAIFQDGPLKYGELIDAIKAHFECGINRAKQHLAGWVRSGYVVKSGKDRTPDCLYKLLTMVPNEHQNGATKLIKITEQPTLFNEADPKNSTSVDLPF
jgi:hypothetical protein